MKVAAIAPVTDEVADIVEPTSNALLHRPIKLIKKSTVLERTTWSDTTLWRRVKDGDFPRPIKISPGRVGWVEADVDAWLQGRAAVRG